MKIHVTIEGTTPLIMGRFTEEDAIKVSAGTSTVSVGSKGTPREQAKKKAYSDSEGNLYIPGPNIFAGLIEAGKFHKSGKSKVTTKKSSLIPAGISLLDIICPLGTKDFEVDSRSVVIPATGGRIMAHRPRLDTWRLSFQLEVDTRMFSEQFVRALVDDFGQKIGLGNFRPERKGPFGKFVVTEWRVEQERKAA